jgi:hypothetical protein
LGEVLGEYQPVLDDVFNEFIRDNGIEEMDRKGCRFTWSNKQTYPIMSVLDRV